MLPCVRSAQLSHPRRRLSCVRAHPQSRLRSIRSSMSARSIHQVTTDHRHSSRQDQTGLTRRRGRPEIFEKKRRYGMLVWQSRHPTLNEYLGQACDAIAAQLALVRFSLSLSLPSSLSAPLTWGTHTCQGAVHKVTLVVKETATLAQEPLERFIFDFDWLVSPEQIAAASSSSSAHTNDFRCGLFSLFPLATSRSSSSLFSRRHGAFSDHMGWCAVCRPQSGGFPRARLEDELRAFVLKIITSDAFMLALPQGPLSPFEALTHHHHHPRIV